MSEPIESLQRASALLTALEIDLADPIPGAERSSNILTPERRCRLEERRHRLENLKVIGRDPDIAKQVYDKHAVDVVAQCGFAYAPSDSSRALQDLQNDASREALRCLANVLFLVPSTRQLFVDLDLPRSAVGRIRSGIGVEDEFLCSRILFFLTYDTKLNLKELCEQGRLASALENCIGRHADAAEAPDKFGELQRGALAETLKLIFNLTHFCPSIKPFFAESIHEVLNILGALRGIVQRPLDPPIRELINVLLNIPLTKYHRSNLQKEHMKDLAAILDASLKFYPTSEMDTTLAPLVSLLRRLHSEVPEVRPLLRDHLLPTPKERNKPLGQSDSLFSRLIQQSNNTSSPTLRTLISQLFYDLSDSSPSIFVQNVGYGYASGFLMNNGIDVSSLQPPPQSSSTSTHDRQPTNPITGQYLDVEPQVPDGPEMTDEEKEREAEKLFVLFERLKRNGVIDVVNPVEAAARAGRFEEIDDEE